MNTSLLRLSLIVGLASPIGFGGALPAFADYYSPNNTRADQDRLNAQRQQQALQQQAAQGYSPSVSMGQRWEEEWRQQHPGEPMPNFGILEKMHRGEIMNNTNRSFNQMRANRQAELQRNHNWARQNQEQQNASRGIRWSPQQWQAWEGSYDGQMRQNAQDYLNGVKQAGEIFQQQEDDRKRREIYRPPN